MSRITHILKYAICITLLLSMGANDLYASSLTEFSDPSGGSVNTTSIDTCTDDSGLEEHQITSKVVYCIRKLILYSVGRIMEEIAQYMFSTVVVCFALAMAFLGIRLIGGEPQIFSTMTSSLIRWSIVLWFFHSLHAIAFYLFAITDWLIVLVTEPGFTPWAQVDEFFSRLFGFAPDTTLVNGMAGVIFAMALSSTSGGSVFGIAMMAIYNLMLFVLEIVYVYLIALLIMGFMMIVSPIIVPLAIFRFTEKYFIKWLKNVIGAILLPVLLYAFLYISLGVFAFLIQNALDAMSQEISDARGNPIFEQFWRSQQPAFSWIAPGDPSGARELHKYTEAFNEDHGFRPPKVHPPMSTEHNPFNRSGQEMNSFMMFATSYDPKELQQILFSFIGLWVYASLLLGMVQKMPLISRSIAGSAYYNPGNGGSMNIRGKRALGSAGLGAGFIAGGWVGSQAGGAIGGDRGRSIGAIGLGAIGAAKGQALGNQIIPQLRSMIGRR